MFKRSIFKKFIFIVIILIFSIMIFSCNQPYIKRKVIEENGNPPYKAIEVFSPEYNLSQLLLYGNSLKLSNELKNRFENIDFNIMYLENENFEKFYIQIISVGKEKLINKDKASLELIYGISQDENNKTELNSDSSQITSTKMENGQILQLLLFETDEDLLEKLVDSKYILIRLKVDDLKVFEVELTKKNLENLYRFYHEFLGF